MKLIHISDLHLGKRVNEFSMLEGQALACCFIFCTRSVLLSLSCVALTFSATSCDLSMTAFPFLTSFPDRDNLNLFKAERNPKATWKYVPIQDFSRPWTDADLYTKYGLSPDEIAFIEATVKPME